jgi:hypothetical protein
MVDGKMGEQEMSYIGKTVTLSWFDKEITGIVTRQVGSSLTVQMSRVFKVQSTTTQVRIRK